LLYCGVILSQVTVECKRHEDVQMRGVAWYGKRDMRIVNVGKPAITDPTDAIIKVQYPKAEE